MQVKQIIKEKYDLLTKSEKKVANIILSSPDQVAHGTMNDIKGLAKVGDATIIRFCQKLGYSGFSDLKIDVAKEDYFEQENSVSINSFFEKSAEKITKTLEYTKKLLQQEVLEKAIELVSDSKNIYIFGVGTSGNTGQDLEAMFLRIGIQAKSVSDPHFQAQIASLLHEDDLVIGISLSGKTKDIYDSLSIAHTKHAKIISLTNYLLSPIAQQSDLVLQTATDEFFDGASLSGKISQLYICELLVKGFEKRHEEGSLTNRESVIRAIMNKSME